MELVSHTIELRLDCFGTCWFSKDIDEILPDFFLDKDRKTIIVLRSYGDPDRFVLTITVGSTLSRVAKLFIEKLAKDIGRWANEKLSYVLRKKRSPDGQIFIRFDDVHIEYSWTEVYDIPKLENVVDIWEKLPEILERIDPLLGKGWEIVLTGNNEWSVHAIEINGNAPV